MKIRCICGKLFEPEVTSQVCCNNNECRELWRKHYREKYRTDTYDFYGEQTIKLDSGCIVESTLSGRCDNYIKCINNDKCLFQIPDHWRGFTCVGKPTGFLRKEIQIKENNEVSVEECYGVCNFNKFK